MGTKTKPLSLEKAIETAHGRLARQAPVLQKPGSPDLVTIRDFVLEAEACVDLLNAAAGIAEERAALLRSSVIQSSFPALLLLREGETATAGRFLVEEWRRTAEALGEAIYIPVAGSGFEVRERRIAYMPSLELERELLTLYNTVVFEVLVTAESHGRGRNILRRLMAQLSLSYDQLGRAFGVSGETVRRWERGSHEIPADRMAALVETDTALKRLVTIFKPERLAHVLRRKAGLFGNESALDWIFRGRITEVAERYEAAFAYQG